jgi:hypothetical protein
VLRAFNRLLTSGGRTGFYTIHHARGLTAWQRRQASRAGPIAVATRRPNAELLAAAGFVDIDEVDVTAEFATTTAAWIDAWAEHRAHLTELVGKGSFDERQHDRAVGLSAVRQGLLRRSLFVATKP